MVGGEASVSAPADSLSKFSTSTLCCGSRTGLILEKLGFSDLDPGLEIDLTAQVISSPTWEFPSVPGQTWSTWLFFRSRDSTGFGSVVTDWLGFSRELLPNGLEWPAVYASA